ncbi:hypothetical protein HRbin29_00239 [bacterium HR29]|jgi:hypothetical protein|nr:hypothetical protein HRbin29_00239 [bacterium HR29]
MAEGVRLTPDGQRALREAEQLCWRMNVAIEAPEHLLAGALLVLGEGGSVGLPDRARIEEALLLVHGAGAEPLREQVMPSPGARAALNHAVARLREMGGSAFGARDLALGVIDSGEVNPLFYRGLGIERDELFRLIGR